MVAPILAEAILTKVLPWAFKEARARFLNKNISTLAGLNLVLLEVGVYAGVLPREMADKFSNLGIGSSTIGLVLMVIYNVVSFYLISKKSKAKKVSSSRKRKTTKRK